MLALVIVFISNLVVFKTLTVYLPEVTPPVLTSRYTLLPVDKPCAELHVIVKVDPTLAYVEVIPGSF